MDRLDVVTFADAINASASPRQAWERFSAVLARHGLHRAALHAGMPLTAENPFRRDACMRAFGVIWEAGFDRRVRDFQGDLRRASNPEFQGFRPALEYLSRARAPLLIDHRTIATGAREDATVALSRDMVDRFGQYQALILPLADPANGTAALLSVWGDEDRDDFSQFVAENLSVLHLAGLFFLAMIEARWPLEGRKVGVDCVPHRALSSRERQVLELLAAGAQTAEIADRLHISDRSVREYLARAKEKLAARTRSDAVARAIMGGLL